jgi:hypothetical protein
MTGGAGALARDSFHRICVGRPTSAAHPSASEDLFVITSGRQSARDLHSNSRTHTSLMDLHRSHVERSEDLFVITSGRQSARDLQLNERPHHKPHK